MSEKGPIGSYVVVRCRTLSWAVTEIVGTLSPDQISELKIPSGEHLAAILVTSFLGAAPRSIDSAGETDLIFEVPQSLSGDTLGRRLGLGNAQFADFEIKSLPGRFREHDAAINRAQEAGDEPDGSVFIATVTSVNTVLRGARDTILRARRQLDKKAKPGHSKNIFLVAHFFEHFTVECYESQFIAHLLEPLGDVVGIDSVWVLWAPTHLVVWSSEHQAWTNLWFENTDPNDVAPSHDESLELLQQIELEFLKQTNSPKGSPYVFSLTAADKDTGTTIDQRHC